MAWAVRNWAAFVTRVPKWSFPHDAEAGFGLTPPLPEDDGVRQPGVLQMNGRTMTGRQHGISAGLGTSQNGRRPSCAQARLQTCVLLRRRKEERWAERVLMRDAQITRRSARNTHSWFVSQIEWCGRMDHNKTYPTNSAEFSTTAIMRHRPMQGMSGSE